MAPVDPPVGEARRLRPAITGAHLLPRTLFGRSLMIIVTPVLLMQAIATAYFYDTHWDKVTERLALGVAGEIALVIKSAEGADPAERQTLFGRAARDLSLLVALQPGATIAPAADGDRHRQLSSALSSKLDNAFTIAPDTIEDWLEVQVQTDDGVVRFLVPRGRLFSSTSTVFILWMVGSGLVLFAVAIVFMRNQIRPIRRLAGAAESFGKGHDVPAFRPTGAVEVRQAARAFLVMRERIRRQISQRTEMLAGVSHDLRTPLTRMKLQLAMLGDGPEIEEFKADVAEMERMIDGYLAFARGEGTETPQEVDLAELLHEAAAGARREGASVEIAAAGPLPVKLRPQAIRRCLANLLSNARRHAPHVWLSAAYRKDVVDVLIDDDGPGIPEERLEDVFRPFYRIDSSRNVETGGTGLGLTIARDIARNHGGDLVLERSPQGGLRCVLRLPV
ncbi:MAG TPA: ATP-binding protein [Alphaproteobacteria bacterium]|nr:ATP-binding protein [Alphaproteobacteria bacterium]